jgi:hypothetical protein
MLMYPCQQNTVHCKIKIYSSNTFSRYGGSAQVLIGDLAVRQCSLSLHWCYLICIPGQPRFVLNGTYMYMSDTHTGYILLRYEYLRYTCCVTLVLYPRLETRGYTELQLPYLL